MELLAACCAQQDVPICRHRQRCYRIPSDSRACIQNKLHDVDVIRITCQLHDCVNAGVHPSVHPHAQYAKVEACRPKGRTMVLKGDLDAALDGPKFQGQI